MRNPFKRQTKAFTGTSGVFQALAQGWAPYPMLGGGANQRITQAFNTAQSANYAWMYRNSPAVRIAIDVIVRNIGQLELRLYEEISDSERQPQPDHPAALSLRYPSEDVAGDHFIRSLFKDFLIHDNAYALITPGTGQQVGLMRLPAFMVEVMSSTLFRAENYRVWPQGAWTTAGTWAGSGTPVDIPPDSVMHWHGEHPLDPRIGLSRLDTLRDVVAEDAALAQAVVELANNGLQAPIWVSRPLEAPEMNAATIRAHEEDIANRLRNRNRKPPVMIEGEQLQSFGTSPQDAQMMEVRKFAIQRVASTYGLPNAAVGLEPVTPYTAEQFYNDTLPPYCMDFTRMLNQRLLVQVFDWTQGAFAFNLDEKTGWAMLPNLISAAGAPIFTRNESRAKVNLPPQKGGDELVTPLNVMVGDNPPPSVGVMPIQNPIGPPQDGSYRTDQGPAPGGDYGQVPKGIGEIEGKFQTAYSMPSYQSRRTKDKQVQDRNVSRFERSLQNYFATFSGELQSVSLPSKSDSRKSTAEWARRTKRLTDVLARNIRDTVGAEGRRYAKRFGGQFSLADTQNYRQAMAQGSAQQINDTVKQEIVELGLATALARLPTHAASAGASLGVKATLFARREAARQSPDAGRRQETWIKDTDRHAAYDGRSVPLGGVWDGPEGELRPGSSPGCQCTSVIS